VLAAHLQSRGNDVERTFLKALILTRHTLGSDWDHTFSHIDTTAYVSNLTQGDLEREVTMLVAHLQSTGNDVERTFSKALNLTRHILGSYWDHASFHIDTTAYASNLTPWARATWDE
jgi:hypothetical protein